MKRKFLLVPVLAGLLIGCSGNEKFMISKGKVGHLTTKTSIQELETIFENDSIVKNLSEGALGNNYFQDDDEYLIYEKGGKHLLTIVPKEQLDENSTIKSVEIFDNRYATDNGLKLSSTFSEINLNTKISKIESSLSSATLFLDEINATMAIDKQELGLQPFSTVEVNIDQIPDLAKVKSFVVWFH